MVFRQPGPENQHAERRGDAMGMDCTGLKPANETGEYFHNTVWAWPPLWDYVTAECSDILSKQDIYRGQYNSGHKISRKKATAMGKRLPNRLRTRKTHAYAKRVRRPGYLPIESPILDAGRAVAEAVGDIATGKPAFYVVNVRKFADFCAASGGFEIS
jgi:hypothetical protein